MSDLCADIVIVGSGPAAVSAAWPLVNCGLKVLMLGQDRPIGSLQTPKGAYPSLKKEWVDQIDRFVGQDISAILGTSNESPKFRVPAFRRVFDGFADAYGLKANNVKPTGALSVGGLSSVWGAGAFEYSDEDFEDFPFSLETMRASYGRVSERIGISGVSDDDLSHYLGNSVSLQPPLPLHPAAGSLLSRAKEKRPGLNNLGFSIGRTRNAVLTQDLPGRKKCTLTNMCLWGCESKSIYNAAHELERLGARENFRHESGAFVTDVIKQETGFTLRTIDLDNPDNTRRFSGAKVLLAAGTIGSTSLALKALNLTSSPTRLLCHPAHAMAFFVPAKLGASAATEGFGLGHLAYRLKNIDISKNDAFGVVFSAEGLLQSELIRHMPLTKYGARSLTRLLSPTLLVANCYLPDEYANCEVSLAPSNSPIGTDLSISGSHTEDFWAASERVVKRVRKAFGLLGAYLLPGSLKAAMLGSDGHFVGSFPMGTEGRTGTSNYGEIHTIPGLYIVDGAVINRVLSKHPTLTIMANADRIGSELARIFGKS